MGKVATTKLVINYTYQNAMFALFCHENEELRNLLLKSWYMKRLAELVMPIKEKKYVQRCLLACSAEDNNCPFLLSNLSFALLVPFKNTKEHYT